MILAGKIESILIDYTNLSSDEIIPITKLLLALFEKEQEKESIREMVRTLGGQKCKP